MRRVLIFISTLIFSVNSSSQSVYDYLVQAKALIESGNQDNAVELLSVALKKQEHSSLLVMRAEAFLKKGETSSAVNDLKSANNVLQNSGDFGLARIYALNGDVSASLFHLERNLKSSFRKSEKEIMLEDAFTRIENTPEWRLFWKNDWYSDAEKGLAEIEYDLSRGNKDDAVTLLEELRKRFPYENNVVYAGTLVSLAEGKYQETVKIITGLLAGEPDNEEYLRTLAEAQMEASNFAGASTTYSKLMNAGFADADLLIFRAGCYQKTGENEKALADVEKYLLLYPGEKTALSLAGKIRISAGDNIGALEYFSRNLRFHPTDPDCFIDRANAYLLSKSWQLAENDYSMSLDLDPGNSESWLNKGIALVNSGKTDDACHNFRQSLRLGNKRAGEFISKYCF